MKQVNEQSKLILEKLWELSKNNNGYFKLDNSVFMPLTIEIIEKSVISLCHYGELNGDLMRDPEMLFWKDEYGDYFPFYFRNDYVGYEDISGEVINSKLVIFNEKVEYVRFEEN